jgi:hypothetical protein
MRLSEAQRAILEREAVSGMVIQYVTRWVIDGIPATGTVNSLLRRGLMKASYYRHNECSASITAAGRKALAHVNMEKADG